MLAGTGPGTSPHSRGVGITLPGLASPAGSNAQRSRWNAARSGSSNIFGMCFFLSTPTPCSPVIEPPASRQASRISPDSSSARSASPSLAPVVADERVQVAVAGVEDVGDLHAVLARPARRCARAPRAAWCAGSRRPGRSSWARSGPSRGRRPCASSRTAARSASSRATRTSSEPHCSQIADDLLEARLALALGAVELDQQRRRAADRVAGVRHLLGRPRSPARPSSRSRPGRRRAATISRDRLARVARGVEEGDERLRPSRAPGTTRSHDLGGDAERALGADERARAGRSRARRAPCRRAGSSRRRGARARARTRSWW